MPSYALSDPPVAAFIIIPLLPLGVFASGVSHAWRRAGAPRTVTRRAVMMAALGGASWMAVTAAIARTGVLREWDRNPPPFIFLVFGIGALAAGVVLSPLGRRPASGLPLWNLVAVPAFRLPLELAMHGMYERGGMPVQMSYAGRNFDILTGATAIVVAAPASCSWGTLSRSRFFRAVSGFPYAAKLH